VFQSQRRVPASHCSGVALLASIVVLSLLPVVLCGCCASSAQTALNPGSVTGVMVTDAKAAGDSPDDPGPLATGLSSALKPKAVDAAMVKVADWELVHAEANFNQQWTFAPLYDGLLATSKTTGDAKYHDAVLRFAERSDWKLLDTRFPHADDEALAHAYLDLYLETPKSSRQAARIANTQAIVDRLIARADDPEKLLWWWSDALFMSPPVLTRMYLATGDRKYLDFMDHEWWLTAASLYDSQEHLYFRDSRFFAKKEANGKKLFWGRGNGWVMGALVQVLQSMPEDYPSRPRYMRQFREMAAAVAKAQGTDGLWRSGMLDAGAYDLPENSGSGFFTYALAYGINQHILDRKTYLPVVQRSWAGLLAHIYADGRLGSIQPIGAQPGQFKASSSYVYGVGGFLLAGSEMHRLADSRR